MTVQHTFRNTEQAEPRRSAVLTPNPIKDLEIADVPLEPGGILRTDVTPNLQNPADRCVFRHSGKSRNPAISAGSGYRLSQV